MKFILLSALFFLAAGGCATGNKPIVAASSSDGVTRSATVTSRPEFAARFAKITEGMPAKQARAILGKPDEIHTRYDPGGINLYHVEEIWRYGVDRPHGFATLGSVAIDDQGLVKYFRGTQHGGELVAKLGETELRRLLVLLSEVKGIQGAGFNPRSAIAAVNAMQALGKETGVAVLQEYLDVGTGLMFDDADDTGGIVVIRLLFEPPPAGTQPATQVDDDYAHAVRPGYFRQPGLGAADWSPDDPTRFPRFPIAVVNDIPLVITQGYSLGGAPEPAAEHLHALLDGGATWRKTRLHPTDDPFSALPKLMSQLPRAQQDSGYEMMISNQLLILVDTVYQRPNYNDDEAVVEEPDVVRALLEQASDTIQKVGIRWDERRSCYVRADGTTLPPIVTPEYRSHFFTPEFTNDPGFKVSLTITRRNRKRVGFSCNTTMDKKPHSMKTLIRVIQVGEFEKVLTASDAMHASTEIDNPDEILKGSYESFLLPMGEKLRIEVIHGVQRFESPVYEP